MSKADSVFVLTPDPSAVGVLIQNLVEGLWPQTEAQRVELFERLNFSSGDEIEPDDQNSPHQMTYLDLGLEGKQVSFWDTYRGEFLSVSTHLYGAPDPRDALTQSGFEELKRQLTKLYDAPTHPWEDEEQPPCIWQANGREITLQLFDTRDSTVMLTIENETLARIINAEEAS
ncbi:hypothetical protein [Glutamicibacter arilaitensis]|uniref:hypothetical protein n=1 Tax=Glutamicibacter arilaitensis TaxID=256701 RepID=UPI003F8F833C